MNYKCIIVRVVIINRKNMVFVYVPDNDKDHRDFKFKRNVLYSWPIINPHE